ncbi:TPA: trypsin-like peptidase domain-containing protein [Candidatus Avacholeplasma faecigallinarum]|nr:trypsin-like peptidase domain-containing protein [Candidatus Avacholeplasma faecigallinarum]
MKKIWMLMCFIPVLILLASCSENEINYSEPSNKNEPDKNTLTEEENHEYKTPQITIDQSSSEPAVTEIEQTVSNVYDSVVSIDVVTETTIGSGSGVLFSSDNDLGLSYIVTCFHVIEDAYSINVTLTDGTVYKASVVGGYKDQDLAVLSIEATNLNYVQFYGNSDNLKLGTQVICIGNPLGILPGSVSVGYLSYVNREVSVDDYNTMKLLQTDVAINSGNSGGALFNVSGALIGIVNAKYADSGIDGLGFAIPINTVYDVIYDLMSTAKYDVVSKTWDEGYVVGDWELGFDLADARYSIGMGIGIQIVPYVSNVYSNETMSGASSLQLKDIISGVTIDYKDDSKTDIVVSDIASSSAILTTIYDANLSVGDSLVFTVTRNNISLTVNVELVQYIYSI